MILPIFSSLPLFRIRSQTLFFSLRPTKFALNVAVAAFADYIIRGENTDPSISHGQESRVEA